MKYILIAVVSADGYIARYSGDLPSSWTSIEEKEKFKEDISNCLWSVMGRKTHELSFKANRKRIIFTRSINNIVENKNHIYFNPTKNSWNDMLNLMTPVSRICILGGTKIYDYFLKKKMIDDLFITIEPVKFVKGLKLFSNLNWSKFPNNFIKEGFKIKKENIINTYGTKYIHFSKN